MMIFVETFHRLVTAPLGAESVRTVEKVGLIDRFQYPCYPHLDQLVFGGGNAQRAQLPITFRDVRSAHRLRLIGLTLQPRHEILQVLVEGSSIFFNSDPVDPRRLSFLEHLKAFPQVGFIEQIGHVVDLCPVVS